MRASQDEGALAPNGAPAPNDAAAPDGAAAPAGQVFPASYAQQRLWFLDRMAPGSSFYNVSIAVRVCAEIDRRTLRRALDALVERHETLRTTVALVDGAPCQIVGAPFGLEPDVIDLRRLTPAERERRTADIVAREAQRPFDLEHGPLIRCTLIGRGMLDQVLVLVLHHIVCDGWSLGILARELTHFYQAFSLGRPDPLPELPIQYVDFAVWQREQLAGPMLDRQLAYWRQKLSGLPALDLPTDRPRPPVLSHAGAIHPVTLAETLSTAVRQAARQFAATPYMVMLAAFAAVLGRYSGQTDLAIGAPLAGRNRPEIEPLVGFFVNSVVLRVDVSGDPCFADLVARVRETALGAMTHQDLPFEKLVEDLRPPRDPSRNPLFQVTFQVVNVPTWDHDATGTQADRPVEIQHRTAIFDLAFTLIDTPKIFSGVIEYSTDLFDAASIASIDRRFQNLLTHALAAPDTPLSRLDLDTQSERDARASLARGPDLRVARPFVLDVIEAQAARMPDAVAIGVPGGEQVTYRALRERWRRLAGRLDALGVRPEVRVGVCMGRSADLVAAMLAVLAAGGTYVPLDPAYPRERLRFMIQDADISVVLTHAAQAGRDGPLAGCARQLLIIDADDGSAPETPAVAAAVAAPAIAPDNLAYVIYTSGSTGQPKGVGISHRSLANHMAWMQDAFPLAADDRVLQRTAASFDASVWELLAPLMAGARLVLLRPEAERDAPAILRTIMDERVSVLQAVPALLRLLAEEPAFYACTSLRRIFCGGEMLPADLAERVRVALAADLINLYGPTEATIDATAFAYGGGAAPLGVPIGRPIANTSAHVLDCSMRPTPAGLDGELYLGGDGLARGYLGRPALTAERFVPDPLGPLPGARLYRTGDRVRMLADGNLLFLGRTDRQTKIRGYRVEPGEIESVIRQVDGVKDCALAAVAEALAAFVVPEPPAQDLVARVRRRVAVSLPEHMMPSRFVVMESLPLLPNGKLDQAALTGCLALRPLSEGGIVAPRTPLEEALAIIWAQTLGLDRVGMTDGFFSDLGGHSLLAMQLGARIREALRVEVPLKKIFIAQTIEQFAADLLDCPAAQRDALQRTAELYVKVSRMPDDELDRALAQAPFAEP
ncbi:MAG TPA: amino acid adenylation domain-containing protein [Xanthobacteraceae bacterium]